MGDLQAQLTTLQSLTLQLKTENEHKSALINVSHICVLLQLTSHIRMCVLLQLTSHICMCVMLYYNLLTFLLIAKNV